MRAAPVALLLVVAGASSCAALSSAALATYGAAGDVLTPIFAKTRDVVPHGVETVRDRGSLIYVVPVEGGVVLVDAGLDEQARAIRDVVGDRRVLGVLVTHAHVDHTAGAAAFAPAPVYMGRADVALLDGGRCAQAVLPHVSQHALHGLDQPTNVVPADDGDVIRVGGATFRAVALPGHTPGSTAWLYRDVLFTGDAVWSFDGEALQVSVEVVSEDEAQAKDSLRRLRDVNVAWIADGHFGVTADPVPKLSRLLHERR